MSHCSEAVAIFNSTHVKGHILFHQCAGEYYTHVEFNLYGMEPMKERGCHVHEWGDERKGCISLGGHWNPTRETHGSRLYTMPRHNGDLINNITPNRHGVFKYKYIDKRLRLRGRENIIGRSIVIHDGIDDLGLGGTKLSLTTGDSGNRLACAIIGMAKP